MSKTIPDLAVNQQSRDKIHSDERTKEWSNRRSVLFQRREKPGKKNQSDGRGRLRSEAGIAWDFESVEEGSERVLIGGRGRMFRANPRGESVPLIYYPSLAMPQRLLERGRFFRQKATWDDVFFELA